MIGPITNDLLNACALELKKRETRKKISEKIIDPIFGCLIDKIQLSFIFFIILQIIMILLLSYISFNIHKKIII